MHNSTPLRSSSVACDHLRIVAIQYDVLELIIEVDPDPISGVKVNLHLLQCDSQKAKIGEATSLTLAILLCLYTCDGDR